MNILYRLLTFVIAFFFFFSCRDPFEPDLPDSGKDILVVEGFISHSGKTTVTLSKVNPFGKKDFNPEADALVTVEGEDNTSQILFYESDGNYTGNLNIDKKQKYRLRIKATNHKEYISDFVEVIIAPEIEDITWEPMEAGIRIFVSTSDPQENTRYYRWEYEETWSFRTPFWSEWIYRGHSNIDKRLGDELFPLVCYHTLKGSQILLNSTVHLNKDVINKLPILEIDNRSPRLQSRYSLLLRQYGLEKRAFEFWQNIQKNSESMGSVFDPLPTQLQSNIKCVSAPDEMVVGFISAGEYKEKRIFISRSEIPGDFKVPSGFSCQPDTIDLEAFPFVTHLFENEIVIPIEYGQSPWLLVVASPECVDCSFTGSSEVPDFWK